MNSLAIPALFGETNGAGIVRQWFSDFADGPRLVDREEVADFVSVERQKLCQFRRMNNPATSGRPVEQQADDRDPKRDYILGQRVENKSVSSK